VASEEVAVMANIMFLLAALLFAFGVLMGSALHTQAINRQYRQVAQRVQELYELEEALAEQEKILARSSRLRMIYQGYPTGASRVDVGR
jgi:hypothetical protein